MDIQPDLFGDEAPVQAPRRPAISAPARPAGPPVQLALLADDEHGQWAGQRTLVDAAGAAGEGTLLTAPPREPVQCRRCHRWLRDPASIAAGIGPVCIHRESGELAGRPVDPPAVAEPLL